MFKLQQFVFLLQADALKVTYQIRPFLKGNWKWQQSTQNNSPPVIYKYHGMNGNENKLLI